MRSGAVLIAATNASICAAMGGLVDSWLYVLFGRKAVATIKTNTTRNVIEGIVPSTGIS
jgi:hypothetical protein